MAVDVMAVCQNPLVFCLNMFRYFIPATMDLGRRSRYCTHWSSLSKLIVIGTCLGPDMGTLIPIFDLSLTAAA